MILRVIYSIIMLFDFRATLYYAGVAELADALALGASVTDVQVQVLSPAPKILIRKNGDFYLLLITSSLLLQTKFDTRFLESNE